jgi:hypothetical protein
MLVLITFGVLFVVRSEQDIIRKRFADRENISTGQFMILLNDVNMPHCVLMQAMLSRNLK